MRFNAASLCTSASPDNQPTWLQPLPSQVLYVLAASASSEVPLPSDLQTFPCPQTFWPALIYFTFWVSLKSLSKVFCHRHELSFSLRPLSRLISLSLSWSFDLDYSLLFSLSRSENFCSDASYSFAQRRRVEKTAFTYNFSAPPSVWRIITAFSQKHNRSVRVISVRLCFTAVVMATWRLNKQTNK